MSLGAANTLALNCHELRQTAQPTIATKASVRNIINIHQALLLIFDHTAHFPFKYLTRSTYSLEERPYFETRPVLRGWPLKNGRAKVPVFSDSAIKPRDTGVK